jgi:flagellar motility protein MotE (MotC chaperone)
MEKGKGRDLEGLEREIATQFGNNGLEWLRQKFRAFDEEATGKFVGFQSDVENKFKALENTSDRKFIKLDSDAQEKIKQFTNNLEKETEKARRRFIRISGVITVALIGALALSLLASYREINKEVIDLQGSIIAAQPLVINAEKSLTEEQSKLVDINNRVRDADDKFKHATEALVAVTQDLEKTRKQYDDMIKEGHKGKVAQ